MEENGLSKNYDGEEREREWKEFNEKKRLRLKNSDFTIIASNCCGTMMYYDMGLPFLSPTINLNIGMKDFVRMVENLPWYMEQEIVEVKEKSSCPIGMLGGGVSELALYITIHLMRQFKSGRRGRKE